VVEIDCSGPDITVQSVQQQHSKSRHTDRHTSTRTSSTTDPNNSFKAVERASSRKGLKRRGAKRSHKSWKEARARFKSSEDLIHRLYVCISGAADQLQTNFAGDFRHILKYVFVMNATQDEEEEELEEDTTEENDEIVSENEEPDLCPDDGQSSPDQQSLSSVEPASSDEPSVSSDQVSTTPINDGAASNITYSTPARNSSGYECGEDALMQESEQSYLRSFSGVAAPLRPGGFGSSRAELLSTSPPSMLASMPVYASNLDQHIDRALLTEGHGGETELC